MNIQHRNIILSVIIILNCLVLSACLQKENPAERMYTILENVALAEKGFEQVQDPLVETEKKEKAIYDKMIKLDDKQYDDKVKLSNEALTMVKERKKYMEAETASIKDSKKEFTKIIPIKNSIEDKKVKKQANDLYELMMDRYTFHATLSKEYLNGIIEDQRLYEMFKDKNVSTEELAAQVEKSNAIYKKIYSANDKFNSYTNQYNQKKLAFYKSAGLIK